MLKFAYFLAIATGAAIVVAGASPWLALAVVAIWIASLWLTRPAPAFEPQQTRGLSEMRNGIAPFIEPLGVPLLLLEGERIVAANLAAREALGDHILGQDARVALRHPEAIELLAGDGAASVTVSGLTTPTSIWKLSRFCIGDQFSLFEFVNRTSEADISRAHTDFVANASHELRTPLASIIGYVETLADAKIDAATRRKFLGTMEGEARRMQSLVEDLMSLSRIEAEKHDAPREQVDLAALAASVVKDMGEVHGQNRVTFAGQGKATVLGDRGQLDQLVRNLIDNAIKYGGETAPVAVAVEKTPERALLRVADSGPGIAREHLPHLTRRFYRTDPARSRASGGTGLGLAIVKHIVERHRGDLDITSVLDKGTTVTVRFPCAEALSQ